MTGLYVVETGPHWREAIGRWGWRSAFWSPLPQIRLELRDCNARDGEWPAVVTLPHETVEFEGLAVPVFEGDVERREWEAERARRRGASPERGLLCGRCPGAAEGRDGGEESRRARPRDCT